MSNTPYTSFRKVTELGHTELMSDFEVNLKGFLDWGLLGIGGWYNVERPASGAYGGNQAVLRPVNDPSYSATATGTRVWETHRKNWVWETGTEYTGGNPIDISGVYVDGGLYGTGDATYGHHYNYPLGRVIFDEPVAITKAIEAEFSYRRVQVYVADDAPWWEELQFNSLRVDDDTFDNYGSGNWGILSNHRVQMPAIIVEAVPQRNQTPYQMGDTSQFIEQSVLFHIVAESRWWRNKLTDILTLLKDQQIKLFNSNEITDYPLDHRGMRVNVTGTYPNLVDNHERMLCRIKNTQLSEMTTYSSRLYGSIVRAVLEVVF